MMFQFQRQQLLEASRAAPVFMMKPTVPGLTDTEDGPHGNEGGSRPSFEFQLTNIPTALSSFETDGMKMIFGPNAIEAGPKMNRPTNLNIVSW